MTEINVMQAGS